MLSRSCYHPLHKRAVDRHGASCLPCARSFGNPRHGVEHFASYKYREHRCVLANGRKKPRMAWRPQRGKKQKMGGVFALRPRWAEILARAGGSLSQTHAAIELALPPVHPPSGQLVAGLERPDVLLTVAGSLRIQGPDDL